MRIYQTEKLRAIQQDPGEGQEIFFELYDKVHEYRIGIIDTIEGEIDFSYEEPKAENWYKATDLIEIARFINQIIEEESKFNSNLGGSDADPITR